MLVLFLLLTSSLVLSHSWCFVSACEPELSMRSQRENNLNCSSWSFIKQLLLWQVFMTRMVTRQSGLKCKLSEMKCASKQHLSSYTAGKLRKSLGGSDVSDYETYRLSLDFHIKIKSVWEPQAQIRLLNLWKSVYTGLNKSCLNPEVMSRAEEEPEVLSSKKIRQPHTCLFFSVCES